MKHTKQLKQIETIIVPCEERLHDLTFVDPTSWFLINANGDAVYFKTRSRIKAREQADIMYGKDKYVIRSVNP